MVARCVVCNQRLTGRQREYCSPECRHAITCGAAAIEQRRVEAWSCRVCGKALVTGPERTLGRCRGCPSDFDVEMWEALKRWRVQVGAFSTLVNDEAMPEYTVFNLMAGYRLPSTSFFRRSSSRREPWLWPIRMTPRPLLSCFR